jgi:hypothetical protein
LASCFLRAGSTSLEAHFHLVRPDDCMVDGNKPPLVFEHTSAKVAMTPLTLLHSKLLGPLHLDFVSPSPQIRSHRRAEGRQESQSSFAVHIARTPGQGRDYVGSCPRESLSPAANPPLQTSQPRQYARLYTLSPPQM